MNLIADPSLTVDAAVRDVAARFSEQPLDEGVRQLLNGACRAPEMTRKAAVDCVQALFIAGLLDEAEQIYAAMAQSHPDEPVGPVGLAQVATQRETWPQALAAWDRVLSRFSGRPNTGFWRARRAIVLMNLGRGKEAEAILRELVGANPNLEQAFVALVRLLRQTGRLEQALEELEASPLSRSESAAIVQLKIDILVRLRRPDAANAEFMRLLAQAEQPAILGSLFDFAPAIYEGAARRSAWLSLLEKLEPMLARVGPETSQEAEALRLRLHLALRDYPTFLASLRRLGDGRRLGRHDRMLRAAAQALGDPAFPDFSKPKIFGIGLGKTGTTTLGAALTILGFKAVDFMNELTRERMSEDDLPIFDAFTDPPAGMTFESNFERFSNAKFIYTTRSPESWRDSKLKHWRRHTGDGDPEEIRAAMERPEKLVVAYRVHEMRVRRFFSERPRDCFLEFDIFGGQGWPQLCEFLGVPIPAQPFPWSNRNPVAG